MTDLLLSRAYTRIYADADGVSHFSDETLDLAMTDYAPPAAPLAVSLPRKAEAIAFLSIPPGWFGDWHPAPRRQFILCLSSEIEVQVRDGEIRRFKQGDVLLVEDTTGPGHSTRVVGADAALFAAVPIAKG